MAAVALTEKFLAEIAGWKAMKESRVLLAGGRVLNGSWNPPKLAGSVRTEAGLLRAGLIIKSRVNVENLCPCRQSRQWGTMCAHSIGVGLWVLQQEAQNAAKKSREKESLAAADVVARETLRRQTARRDADVNLRLWVIFSPNWKSALARGKVTLFFEGETAAGRRPLNAVPFRKEDRVDAMDARLLNWLESRTGGQAPAMWMVDLAALAELLPVLKGHSRLSVGRKIPIVVSEVPWIPAMEAVLEESGELRLQTTETASDWVLIPGSKSYIALENQMQPLGLPQSCAAVLRGPLILERRRIPEFLQSCGAFLTGDSRCRANFTLEQFELSTVAPAFSLHLTGGLAQLRARLECAYGAKVFRIGGKSETESLWMPDAKSPFRYIARDGAAESGALRRLLRHGFLGTDKTGFYEMTGRDAVLDFFARDYPNLRREWTVVLEERLKQSVEGNLERVRPRFEARASSGMEWLDFRVSYSSESGTRFSESEIQSWLLSGRSHRKLRNGKIAMLDVEAVAEFKESMRDCSPEQRDGIYRLASAQAGFLDAAVRDLGWSVSGDAGWRSRVWSAQDGQAKTPELGKLDSILRPYQKRGVDWLDFLRRSGFGGILADEMGLGKTLQILALLQAMRISSELKKAPVPKALVICPTSLVFNWVSEAKRFAPALSVLALHGPRRKERLEEAQRHDVIVTSYALIRRNLDWYRRREFDFVVLDEAQHIKNRKTQNAKAVKAIRGRHRFVLTGTPMENSVLDLWSIFEFLMPGYLGSASDFRDRYEMPIAKEKSREVMERLRRRLRPFVLRRTKREVAPDLPQKLEQTVLCPLSAEQREVYSQVMDASRGKVLSCPAANEGQQRMIMLQALTRLRQICCDLRLLQLPQPPQESSGKAAVFRELLEQAFDGNHRVLVFSQFTSLLRLLQQELQERRTDFCYLDGATKNRETEVRRFQKSSIPVFLISLKAGGVGLNLTGADTVIHFDPWWNPAVEDQATGRSHRIGQTRIVTSYKLIAADTVEQKILQLQERKRQVIQDTLSAENSLAETLTLKDFQRLFEED